MFLVWFLLKLVDSIVLILSDWGRFIEKRGVLNIFAKIY